MLTSIFTWLFTSKLGTAILSFVVGKITGFFTARAVQAKKDADIDQHAKDVAKETDETHDPSKMDGADSDLLSGK